MKIINELIPEAVAYALGWTVLHALWQGIVIALLLLFALNVLKNKSPKWHYEVSCFALFSVLVTALSTFIFYLNNNIVAETGLLAQDKLVATEVSTVTSLEMINSTAMLEQYLPWVVSFWLIGVAVLGIRFFVNFLYLHHFRKQTTALGHVWQEKIEYIKRKMNVKKSVQLAESALAKTPMTLGFLKPIIIFPVGTLNQLSPAETEAILAHELAHIFRNDYIQNIFISIIEILFYYHPAVWWISSRIHALREDCCDDMAVKVCGDSVTYVKALVKLEDLKRMPSPALAMSFSGRKNTLLSRVKRILNQGQPKSDFMEKIAATCLILMLIFGFTLSADNKEELTLSEKKFEVNENAEANCLENDRGNLISIAGKIQETDEGNERKGQGDFVVAFRKDTIPGKAKQTSEGYTIIESEKNNQNVSVEIRNDKIVFLEIDGEEIPREDFSKHTDITTPILENLNKERERIVFPEDEDHFVFKEYNNGKTKVLIAGGEDDGEEIEVIVDGDRKIIINGKEIALPEEDFDFDAEELEARFNMEDFEVKMEDVHELLSMEEERIHEMLEQMELEKSIDIERVTTEMEEKLVEMKERLAREEEHREEMLERIREDIEAENEQLHIEMEHLQELEEERFHKLEMEREKNDVMMDAIERELIRDGLVENNTNYSFHLNLKKMKVNGEKQSESIREKYISIIEDVTGKKIDDDFNFRVTRKTRN